MKRGSAILIHGNLNEPAGVKLMLEWVARQEKDSIYFLPLASITGTRRDRGAKLEGEAQRPEGVDARASRSSRILHQTSR
ncbi:MAG: hypothetical protein VYC95_02755 [Verrucomicrobiota bacterium]|nr:hypothetical protein [Verrucomicrobiota bacterium]